MIGSILSAVGMFCLVLGILQAGEDNVLMLVFLAAGVAFLLGFFLFIRSRTGVIFTAATVGILLSSLSAERLAKRYSQKV